MHKIKEKKVANNNLKDTNIFIMHQRIPVVELSVKGNKSFLLITLLMRIKKKKRRRRNIVLIHKKRYFAGH